MASMTLPNSRHQFATSSATDFAPALISLASRGPLSPHFGAQPESYPAI